MRSTCAVTRRELLASGPRNHDARVSAAEEHLRGCESCRAFLAEMHGAAEALHELGRNEMAPQGVRERLFARIAQARVNEDRRREQRGHLPWLIGSIAAAVLILALTLPPALRPEPDSALVAMIAQDHANALSGDRLESTDRETIEAWLAVRLSFAVHVPLLEGAQLVGARICRTAHGRGAVIEYRVGDRAMSYFILPQPADQNPFSTQPGFRHAYAAGYRAVLWSDMGLTHAMLGALPAGILEKMARDCVTQATRATTVRELRQDRRRIAGRFLTNPKGGSA